MEWNGLKGIIKGEKGKRKKREREGKKEREKRKIIKWVGD